MIELRISLDTVLAAVGVVIALVALALSVRIARRQDRLARYLAGQDRIDDACKALIDHLTQWHDGLADLAGQQDTNRVLEHVHHLHAFQSTQPDEAPWLKSFMQRRAFQGPLRGYLDFLEAFPECDDCVAKLERFEKTAIDFKMTLSGAPVPVPTRLEDVGAAYQKAIDALTQVRRAQAARLTLG
jgi:hypothetical protein